MSHHNDRDDARFDEHGNTRPTGSNYITTAISDDGIDRRGFLKCMAWAGSATVWALAGGIPTSFGMKQLSFMTEAQRKSIFFPDQRQPHWLQQGSKQGRHGDASGSRPQTQL